jgi:hypothetical protein
LSIPPPPPLFLSSLLLSLAPFPPILHSPRA